MTLAPYFVLWVFPGLAVLALGAGVAALVWPEWLGAWARRWEWGDLPAAWLAGAQLHFLASQHTGWDARIWGDPEAWWAVAAGLLAWGVLRFVPNPLRNASVSFGIALALWAFTWGAGEAFIVRMEVDRAILREQPATVMFPEPLPEDDAGGAYRVPAALARSQRFDRLSPQTRALRDDVIHTLERGTPLEPGLRAAALEQLVPPLLEHYERDLTRLRTYQWIQAALALGLLLAWGLGERLTGSRGSGPTGSRTPESPRR